MGPLGIGYFQRGSLGNIFVVELKKLEDNTNNDVKAQIAWSVEMTKDINAEQIHLGGDSHIIVNEL